MKKFFLATAGVVLCVSISPAFAAPNSQPPPAFQKAPVTSHEAVKTFTGTVTKQGDLYILSDKADKTNYQLDDLKKASEYEGKRVKVTGTLDAENLTIHVESIVEIT